MGLFGGIGKLLFGKPAAGYQSKHTGEYEDAARTGAFNRFNATKGMPVTAGDQGYDFSGMDSAKDGFKNPQKFDETYKGTKFNFASTPRSAYNAEYELGANDLRRESSGELEKLRETVGPRRQGLLLKAGGDSQRNLLERLAKMKAALSSDAARETTQLSKEQQIADAGENYKSYQSLADLEGKQADEDFRNRSALFDAERNKIALQSDLTERERAYQDEAIQYLMDLYSKGVNQSQTNAELKNQRRGQNLGFLSSVASSAVKSASGGG